MSEFTFDDRLFINAIDKALLSWSNLLFDKTLELVPRDIKRLPKNINRKDWRKPKRNIRVWNRNWYRKPVEISWNWYSWVTWNLKRSIWHSETNFLEYSVWVYSWITEKYAFTQEFWDERRNIKPRSFINKALENNLKEIQEQMQKTFNELLK